MLASGKLCGGYWREEHRRYRELTPYSWGHSANANKLTARRGRRQDAPTSRAVGGGWQTARRPVRWGSRKPRSTGNAVVAVGAYRLRPLRIVSLQACAENLNVG